MLFRISYLGHSQVVLDIILTGDLDFTMLHKVASRARFTSLLPQLVLFSHDRVGEDTDSRSDLDSASVEARGPLSYLADAAHILHAHSHRQSFTQSDPPTGLGDLPMTQYSLILHHIQKSRPHLSVRHYAHFPHPIGDHVCVLPPLGKSLRSLTLNTRLYTTYTEHAGNSAISYDDEDGSKGIGFIVKIWRVHILDEQLELAVVVPHRRLSMKDSSKTPYHQRGGFNVTVVYNDGDPVDQVQRYVVVETKAIKSHTPFYSRPTETFGIKHAILVIVDSLSRFRI